MLSNKGDGDSSSSAVITASKNKEMTKISTYICPASIQNVNIICNPLGTSEDPGMTFKLMDFEGLITIIQTNPNNSDNPKAREV